jgi:hypothetical protein
MKMIIAIIDGMGGGIGVELISRLKEFIDPKKAEIIALGTNAVATERMVKAGAVKGATGENAIRVSVEKANFILGPMGIVIANSMMGEITAVMSNAVFTANAKRILLPLQNEHFYLAGFEQVPFSKVIDRAIDIFKEHYSLLL